MSLAPGATRVPTGASINMLLTNCHMIATICSGGIYLPGCTGQRCGGFWLLTGARSGHSRLRFRSALRRPASVSRRRGAYCGLVAPRPNSTAGHVDDRGTHARVRWRSRTVRIIAGLGRDACGKYRAEPAAETMTNCSGCWSNSRHSSPSSCYEGGQIPCLRSSVRASEPDPTKVW